MAWIWSTNGRRDATCEPESHLLQYGATELVRSQVIAKYEAKQAAAGNKKLAKGITKKGSAASIYNVYHSKTWR